MLASEPSGPSTWFGTLAENSAGSTGLLYKRNRYFDPVSRRFKQADPIGLGGGLHLYGFADGDPVNFTDPFGLCPVPQLCTAALGAVLGGGGQMFINAVSDRPLMENVDQSALVGAVIGGSFGAAAPEGAAALFTRGAAAAAGTAGAAGASRVMLEMGKQGKHIPGHNNFKAGKSVFTHSNPQALLNEFAGTGQRILGAAGGPGKERVNFGQVIWQINVNRVMTNTTRGIIHYSNKGAHIVPGNP